MNTRRLIYRLTSWPVTLAICLVIVLGTVAIWLWPRTVPFDQCSKLYQKYADKPGLEASFIKDYRIDDTIFVDVTLIVATDSASWNSLRFDLNIPELNPEIQKNISDNVVFSKQVNKHDNSQTIEGDSPDAELMAFSYSKQTICVIHVENETEAHEILYHNFDKSIQQKK